MGEDGVQLNSDQLFEPFVKSSVDHLKCEKVLIVKIVIWIIVLIALGYAVYLGDKHKIMVHFLPADSASESNKVDSDIHDAVNFVKKPL